MAQHLTDRWGRVPRSRVEELLAETEQALRLTPSDQTLLWLNAECYLYLGQLDEAERVFQRLLTLFPPSSQDAVKRKVAEIRWRKGDISGAWQFSLGADLFARMAAIVAVFFVLAVIAFRLQRHIGSWTYPQIAFTFLSIIWYTINVYFMAWLVLGAPFPDAVGNTNSYKLLLHIIFWGGVLFFTWLYRRRFLGSLSDSRPQLPRWLFGIALIVGVGIVLQDAFFLFTLGLAPKIPSTLSHSTLQSVAMLVIGVPVAGAAFIWWLETLYEQARYGLHIFPAGFSMAIAVGWIAILATLLGAGMTMMFSLFDMLLQVVAYSAYLLIYESTRRWWLPWLLLATDYYVFFIQDLITRVGRL